MGKISPLEVVALVWIAICALSPLICVWVRAHEQRPR
jgi:hypothetical protein